MKLIGLNGRKQSGKDLAFTTLRDLNPDLRFERICFADDLKLSGMRALGFLTEDRPEAVRLADEIKDTGLVSVEWADRDGNTRRRSVTGREFWQFYGTEAHRKVFGEDFWVDHLLPEAARWVDCEAEWLDDLYPNADVLVETTTRFPNEAQRIRYHGGEVWHIDADERLGPLPEGSHDSEQPLPAELITLTVPNNSTKEQYTVALAAAWSISNGIVYR